MPRPHGYARDQRVRKAADFKLAFHRGKRLHCGAFVLHYRTADNARARLGVVIRKKTVARAHERNRIRRIAREAFRHNTERLPVCDVVLNIRQDMGLLSNRELEQCLNGALQRLCKQAATPAAGLSARTSTASVPA